MYEKGNRDPLPDAEYIVRVITTSGDTIATIPTDSARIGKSSLRVYVPNPTLTTIPLDSIRSITTNEKYYAGPIIMTLIVAPLAAFALLLLIFSGVRFGG